MAGLLPPASVSQRLTPAKGLGLILPNTRLAVRMGGKWVEWGLVAVYDTILCRASTPSGKELVGHTGQVCPKEAIGPMASPSTTCFRANYQQSRLGTDTP